VHAAFPMNGEQELSQGDIYVDEDFFNERSHNALLEPRTGAHISPDIFQLADELLQLLAGASHSLFGRVTVLVNPFIDLVHVL